MFKPVGQQFRDSYVIPELEKAELYTSIPLFHGANIVMGTFAHESNFIHLRQRGFKLDNVRGAFGLAQQEYYAVIDVIRILECRYKKYYDYLLKVAGDAELQSNLLWNIPFQILMCRANYLLVNNPLPAENDIIGMAAYWKKYYNTAHGKGTEEEFVASYREYCL